jgi:hypothetical protein
MLPVDLSGLTHGESGDLADARGSLGVEHHDGIVVAESSPGHVSCVAAEHGNRG